MNSGDVSKMPAALRTAKYSNLSDSPYFSAARCPDQWLHRPVSLSADVRAWNGCRPDHRDVLASRLDGGRYPTAVPAVAARCPARITPQAGPIVAIASAGRVSVRR